MENLAVGVGAVARMPRENRKFRARKGREDYVKGASLAKKKKRRMIFHGVSDSFVSTGKMRFGVKGDCQGESS